MEFLKKLIAAKEKRAAELKNLINASNDINEARSLMNELEGVNAELTEARTELANKEAEAQAHAQAEAQRSGGQGTLIPMATYGMATTGADTRNNDDPLSTMEYRKAFMNYVQNGTPNELLKRAAAENVSADLGILLPNTIVQEVIKEAEKVYGQLYSKVKHTNLKGGVQYPIGSFSAKLVWGGTSGTDKEHGVSEKQKAGAVDKYVQFTYHIGEVRIAQSLLQSVVSVEAFEKELVNALVEGYIEGMDVAILDGTGVNQPTGIFANTTEGIQRIATDHIIEFTAEEMADWKTWYKKFFAKLPLSMRKVPFEFVMTSNTYDSNISTLVDDNNRPLAKEVFDAVAGDVVARFKGKEVTFIEEGASIKNFDDAANGEYFGLAWLPNKAYTINTNLQFSYVKYFDHDTNQYITKGLVIADGKILDPKYIYLFKKVVKA